MALLVEIGGWWKPVVDEERFAAVMPKNKNR
jgi:hypothetical protein